MCDPVLSVPGFERGRGRERRRAGADGRGGETRGAAAQAVAFLRSSYDEVTCQRLLDRLVDSRLKRDVDIHLSRFCAPRRGTASLLRRRCFLLPEWALLDWLQSARCPLELGEWHERHALPGHRLSAICWDGSGTM